MPDRLHRESDPRSKLDIERDRVLFLPAPPPDATGFDLRAGCRNTIDIVD
jgi:hypothetical protein